MADPDLTPAIVQDADDGRVLMLAWMDADALRRTRETGEALEQPRLVERRTVDRDLVGAGAEQRESVGDRADTAAHGERDRELCRGAVHEFEQRPAALQRRRDVEEDEFVGAEIRVARRELDRIAHVPEILEPHALDDPAVGDVEARDHALLDHRRTPESARAPAGPLRSGWN